MPYQVVLALTWYGIVFVWESAKPTGRWVKHTRFLKFLKFSVLRTLKLLFKKFLGGCRAEPVK